MELKYRWQYVLAWTCLAGGLLFSLIQANADGLELTNTQRSMVAIVQGFSVGLGAFLPKITKPPSDTREGMD